MDILIFHKEVRKDAGVNMQIYSDNFLLGQNLVVISKDDISSVYINFLVQTMFKNQFSFKKAPELTLLASVQTQYSGQCQLVFLNNIVEIVKAKQLQLLKLSK